jgi:hypothetical protein
MARTPNFGSAKPVTSEDFQDRLRRIFEAKPSVTWERPAAAPRRKPVAFKP